MADFSSILVATLIKVIAAESANTLLTASPCKEGLVIVGDRLTKDVIRGKVNGSSKLVKVGATTVIGSTGVPTFYRYRRPEHGRLQLLPLFSSNESAARYFQKNSSFTSVYPIWESLAKYIAQDFVEAFQKFPRSNWPEPLQDNPILFQTCVFHFNQKAHAYEILVIRFRYSKTQQMSFKFEPWFYRSSELEKVHPFSFGNIDVVDLLAKGTRFDSFDKENVFSSQRKMFGKPRATLSRANSLKYAERLTLLSHLWTCDSNNPVGDRVDELIISESGVFWISRDKIIDQKSFSK